MSGNLNLEMRLTANTSQATAALTRFDAQIHRFTDNSNRAFTSLHNKIRGLYRELNGFGAVSGLVAAAGGYGVARDLIARNLEFEKSLLDIKQTAQLTTKQAAEMRQIALEQATNNLATPLEMADGLKALTAAGMKYEQIASTIQESARAAVAFRTEVADMAKLDFDLQDKLGLNPKDIKDAHNMLLYHAKSGRFEAMPMATEAPKYLNSAASVGIKGMQGLNFTGAMTQVLMRLAPATQPSEVSTFMEHGLGHITAGHLTKKLSKFGIDVEKYMPNGKFYGEGGVDGVLDLAAEMKRKGLDNPFMLDKAGFREMYTKKFWKQLMEYQDEIRKAMDKGAIAASEDMVGHDKSEIEKSNYAKLKKAQISREKLENSDGATGAVGAFTGAMDWAGQNPVAAGSAGVAAILGGRWLLQKGIPRWLDGGEKVPGVGKLLGGVQQVHVTNWPGGFGSDTPVWKRKPPIGATAIDAVKNNGAGVAGVAATSGVLAGAAITTLPFLAAGAFYAWRESADGQRKRAKGLQLEIDAMERRKGGLSDPQMRAEIDQRLKVMRDRKARLENNALVIDANGLNKEMLELREKTKNASDPALVQKIEAQIAQMQQERNLLLEQIKALANRPQINQVVIDGRVVSESVNRNNAIDARRQ